MSYTKLVKKWQSEANKKFKQEQTTYKLKKEQEQKFKDAIYIAKGIQEEKEKIEAEEKQKRIAVTKENIFLQLRKNNPFTYRQFLIVWDILTNNYLQLENDLSCKKISGIDLKPVFEYIENFSPELISDYWKDRLLIA